MAEREPLRSLRDDRYAIVAELGEGGQATTFDAVDKREGRPVVVKRFRVRGATSWKQVELAEREAQVLASLSHPSVPRYVEHFEENGELFLVTEKIEGESLAARRQAKRVFAIADVERFLGDARASLAYLHGRSPPVVHRDIKPSNVIARSDGSFAIIDFGSVRDRLKPEGGSTIVGTFGYMAPEQFQGRAMPASDVYAVGVTALVMLTGAQPEDLPHKGLAIDVAASLRGLPVAPGLVRAIERMVEVDPDARATSVPELGGASPAQRPPPKQKATRESAKELRKKAERAAQEVRDAARAERDAAHDERRAARAQRRDARREAHVERHPELRARWEQEMRRRRAKRGLRFLSGDRLPPLLRSLFVVGLSIAEIGVALATGVIAPSVLTLLSILFGSALRDAAREVAKAGKRAGVVLKYAKRAIEGRVPSHLVWAPLEGRDAQPRQRSGDAPGVRVAEEAPRVRVAPPATWGDDEQAEAEDDAANADAARRRGSR